ncbi:MAG TPA: EAL domain-containing protein [Treponemataceae bacterium]|nr:EAL domain-containing protein [Treponemataceae bacterium]
MLYVLDFDVMALIISSITLFMYSVQKQISTRQNILFMFILICSVISSFAGVLSSIAINYLPDSNLFFTYISTMIFYINHNSIPICVFSYILALTGRYPKRFLIRSLLCIPYFFSLSLILTNPLTNFVFFISPQGEYCKSWGVPALYASAVLYLSAIVFLLVFKKVRISAAISYSVYICLLIPVIAIFFQIQFPYIVLESFAASICFLFIFMGIQNKKFSIDPQTKFYTPEVFSFLINERIEKENRFYVIVARSPDISVLQELFDYNRYSSLLSMFSSTVQSICKSNFEIFSLEEGLFAIIPKKQVPKSSIGNTALELVNRLEKIWTIESVQIEITLQVTILQYPLDFLSFQEIAERIDLLSRFTRKIGNRHIFYGKDINSGDIRYKAEIITQLQDIFRQGTLDLRYQPIYDSDLKQYFALEVSLFIANHENRQIRQNDIYKTALETGQSNKLSTMIFKQALWWFVREKLSSLGIKKIELKLQESQCIDSAWANNILKICRECSFEPENLCLLVSESILSFNKSAFYTNIEILKKAGVNFAIDGFGTDYSNLEMIIKSPIDGIKIDKELLHESFSSIKGRQLLKGTLSMLKKLSYRVIAEGIETKEQNDYVMQSGCSYLQGFYICKPAPGNTILAHLVNSKNLY